MIDLSKVREALEYAFQQAVLGPTFSDEQRYAKALAALGAIENAPDEYPWCFRSDAEILAHVLMLWRQYGQCPDEKLTTNTIELKRLVLSFAGEIIDKGHQPVLPATDDGNYQGAMADLEDLVRVCLTNRSGLTAYLKDNYPRQFAESSDQPSTESVVDIEAGAKRLRQCDVVGLSCANPMPLYEYRQRAEALATTWGLKWK